MTINRKQAFFKLTPSTGFPYKLFPPQKDVWAEEICKREFGESRVQSVIDTLHRSEISYEAMVNDLKEYDVEPVPCQRDNIYLAVLETIRRDFSSMEKIVPLTMGAVAGRPEFPKSKSPGLPYKLEGYRTKQECIEAGKLHEINRDWQHIGFKKGKVELPDVALFARAQIARKGKEKIRATWGYPLSVYMEEGRFFYPFQDKIKSREHNFPVAYGYEIANGGMSVVNEILMRNPGCKYLCLDWKQFDKRVPPWVIRDAFSIIADKIDWEHVRDIEDKVWPVRPEPSKVRWKRMVDYFINTPIRTCKGERFLVSVGVPSGSCWTNLVDSIINVIYLRYAIYQTTNNFPREELVLGDDSVVVCNGIVNLEDIAHVAFKHFGAILNVAKSYVTTNPENVVFLGYFNYMGYPFKNQDFLVASFIQPEHTRKTALDACSAALGQLWSGFDPVYATVWYRVIVSMAEKDQLSFDQVVQHLRENPHRHKYLMHVGLDAATLTIPAPNQDGYILDVLPRRYIGKIPLPRRY